MMTWFLRTLIICMAMLFNITHADFLPPNQAFQFNAISTSQDRAELTWKIADGYYLYADQFKVSENEAALKLKLPIAQDKDDPTFGMTKVYYQQVKFSIPVQPNQQLKIQWQGCSEDGLCYPVQRTSIQTDANGLLPEKRISENKKLFSAENSASKITELQATTQIASTEKLSAQTIQKNENIIPNESAIIEDQSQLTVLPLEASEATSFEQSQIQTSAEAPVSSSIDAQWNNDQFFFNLLSDHNLVLNLLVFLGLGVLLAFLPCSLPLIPILSGILVQRKTGYRAALIAGVFVLGMAMVYAIIGWAVAQLGYNFQRWFQSPIFIGLFAILFVLFALNLFGAFQLSLPQQMLHKLDQWQNKQKGGTLLGALVMGMIAALIVGPCMSAPLAGALLFVSQLNQPVMGSIYLFVLGLGIGLPLFVASVFGSQYLPKPGLWMDRLKISFGFVMLALAIYFVRPLISLGLYTTLMGLVLLSLALYFLWKMLPDLKRIISKIFIVILSLAIGLSGIWHLGQLFSHINVEHAEQTLTWQRVTNEDELKAALAEHANQAVVIDVYADWCVACQPTEHEVLPRKDVQAALQNVARIKLDITHYHPSQDQLLKDWQILGPPTFIFLDASHQEQRELRLTGAFKAEQLIQKLTQLKMGASS
ncbi:thiol:disulfide interchange protein [Acinetobacter sp. ANC 4558]|uniref:protein-disulfide reductase DsbD n=1 Tax=Acinetobacter sp. ANC 4558 TaxID=1977876 RepID=UPI000A354191|nr:protein-disulfide reductase DsbD [Acinetobacter sp. ANC 4558]OTG85566.1 thiol:disulfide interchange protein [Acinetobacter sp. ANC 4558]